MIIKRIAEYKQIDTETITDTVMVDDYDEEGNVIGQHKEDITKEKPIYGMVYRDMTEEELAQLQAEELDNLNKISELTTEEKLAMIVNSIPTELPKDAEVKYDGTIELPFKLGYKWQPMFDGEKFAYELVEDENAIGTKENPIIYTDNSPLINNAFYIIDGVLKVYMSGEFYEF